MQPFRLESIQSSDLQLDLLHPALETIRTLMFPQYTPRAFVERYIKLLDISISDIRPIDAPSQRGAKAYWIREAKRPLAVMVLHFYNWLLLAPQINLFVRQRNGEAIDVRLAHFEELVPPGISPQVAAELAAFWVAPNYRRQGVGTQLFQKAFSLFQATLQPHDYLFLSVRPTNPAMGKAVFNFLVYQETGYNRLGQESFAHIKGAELTAGMLKQSLGSDCLNFLIHPDATATVILAERYDMKLIGYTKSGGPIYGSSVINPT